MSSKPGSQHVPYNRRRYRTAFLRTGRSSSTLNSQEPMFNGRVVLSSTSLPRSLSEIWELESKLSAARTSHEIDQKTTNGEDVKSARMGVSRATSMKLDGNNNVADNLKRPDNSESEPISEFEKEDEHINDDPDEDMKIETNPDTEDGAPKTYFGLSEISLPPSAASYYSGNGHVSRIHDSNPGTCRSVDRLNQYLEARRKELEAGVPGMFLRAVIGQEAGDVVSVVSTIMYAFYLDETQESNDLCTLPVINMKRADLNMHSELKWLLNSCHVDQCSLVFIDEIDLSYYDLFGSLRLVLLNGHSLPPKQEGLKGAVVEFFNCKQDESQCLSTEAITMAEGSSSCALIAEKFAETSPETLAGDRFSRLLLAGILLDTANLTSVQCTSKDKYMATLLLKGAGRFGCNGLYQILKYKMFDISDLKVWDILRRDLKKWTRVAGKPRRSGSRSTIPVIGMSTIGISIEQLLAHEVFAAQAITLFLKSEKLHLLLIISGYYDSRKNFKREVLVATDTSEIMGGFLLFLNSSGKDLPLTPLQPDLGEELRAFEINNGVTSRRTIERLLEEFSRTLRRTWGMLPDLQATNTPSDQM